MPLAIAPSLTDNPSRRHPKDLTGLHPGVAKPRDPLGSVSIQFLCVDAGFLANLVDRISRAAIKIVERLQRQRSVLGCLGVSGVLKLFTQQFELVRLQASDSCRCD
jgi:hypothetical protein